MDPGCGSGLARLPVHIPMAQEADCSRAQENASICVAFLSHFLFIPPMPGHHSGAGYVFPSAVTSL